MLRMKIVRVDGGLFYSRIYVQISGYTSVLNGSGNFNQPVRESNPCRRRERDANHCNSMKLRGMDSSLPHLKDSRERLLDS
jgi:hypothetical protein